MPDASEAGLCHHVTISLPNLPRGLEGLTIAHVSDLHVGRPRRRHQRIIETLQRLEVDLVFLTGDYMGRLGSEDVTIHMLDRVVAAMHPRLGVFGVFGNHDSPALRDRAADLNVHWLSDQVHLFADRPLHILGFEIDSRRYPDLPRLLARWPQAPHADAQNPPPLSLLLCHVPIYLPTAADLGIDLMFSGHTHGGQMRLPNGRALYNSTDMPLHLSSGLLRHRSTLCAVSRGLGETFVPLRFFCRPQLPVYTLRQGPLPGGETWDVENVEPW